MTGLSPLYLGFDLSTQQLKAIAVTSELDVKYNAVFDFDADAIGFDVKKGVLTNEAQREVYAPVAMWLQAIDAVLQQLKKDGLDFARVKGVRGDFSQSFFPCQEHRENLAQTSSIHCPHASLEKLPGDFLFG